MTLSADGCSSRVGSPSDRGLDRIVDKVLTDKQIDEIEARRKKRKVFHDRIPTGPYFYDAMGFVHNEIGRKPDRTPKRRVLRAGLLARSAEWFDAIDMDAKTTSSDDEVGTSLGQYVALVLSHDLENDLESDIERLLAEVRRLRTTNGE